MGRHRVPGPLAQAAARLRTVDSRAIAYYGGLGLIVAAGAAWCLLADEKPWDFRERVADRAAEGKSDFPIRWRMAIGLWWGALAAAALAAGLIAGGRWLRTPLPPAFGSASPALAGSLRLLVVGNTVAAIVVAAWLNAPRLDHSLWGDEEMTMRTYVVGEFQRDADDRLAFRSRSWVDTLFNYKVPNNHVLYSLLARASHALAHRDPDSADPDALYFSEAALRWPAWIAGLAAVGTLTWFLVRLGFPRAAVLAAWLLVLHPWHVRYGSEARGYALLLALAPLLWTALLPALRSGRWRWWLLFALVQFLIFHTHPATIYLLVATNASALAMIVLDPRRPDGRRALAARWFVAGVLSTMAVLPLMLPLLPQLRDYLETPRAIGSLDAAWFRDALAWITTGIPFHPWDPKNPLCLAWADPLRDRTPLFVGIGAVAAAAVAAGCVRLWHASLLTRVMTIPLVLPAPLMVAHNLATGNHLYHWYLLFALPGFLALAAVGTEWASRSVGSPRLRDAAFVAVTLVATSAFGLATHTQRRILREHPSEPLRESVALTRTILNPRHPDIDSVITVGFHMITKGYDPAHRRVGSADELLHWIEEARRTHRPLYVNFAQEGLARVAHPEIMSLLDDPSLFREIGRLPGLDEQCTRIVLLLVDPPATDP